MAEAAGVINRAGPRDKEAFDSVVAGSPGDIREVAHAVRNLVYEVLPETVEVVWPTSGGKQVSGRLSMRSLKLSTVAEVKQPALKKLLQAAVKHLVDR